MKRKWIIVAAAVVLCLPGSLAAQRPPRAGTRSWAFSFSDNRGRIGVVVKTDANPETDKLGARIEGVTPGGPADKAGLKAGDLITRFNGTSLGGLPAEEEGESGPGLKLVQLARKLDPGDTVQVEYRRGSETKKATLVAEEIGLDRDLGRFEFPEPRVFVGPPGEGPRPPGFGFSFCFGDSWCDLELVTLNSDLGEYFGTREGVLVVKAPADSSLPLKSGDVILSIGGRKPSSPSHAMRILRSYDGGETVSIDIMRKQKRMTITWKVPAAEDRWRRMHRERNREREEQSVFRWRGRAPVRLRVV